MSSLPSFLVELPRLFVRQRKEWVEIAIDLETVNRYDIFDERKNPVGHVAEQGGGLMMTLKRFVLRSHRPLEIDIFDRAGQAVLHLTRPFFFFFSDLTVLQPSGELLGRIERRFALLYKRYDVRDASGQVFARIESPIWRLWTFPIVDRMGVVRAQILKKWGGVLAEVFTDADTYLVDFSGPGGFGGEWTPEQRAVLFAAAISIDFDFFENNQGQRSLFDLFNS